MPWMVLRRGRSAGFGLLRDFVLEELRDLARPSVLHDAQLDLQGGSQLSLFLCQEPGEQGYPPRSLEDREVVKLRAHLVVDQLVHGLLVDERLWRDLRETVAARPAAQLLEVGRDEHPGVRLPVAEDHGLRDVL